MNCEEERKLYKLSIDADAELKLFSLPPATEPLGIETPVGHNLTKEYREEIYKAREKFNVVREVYQDHIKNCPTCNH